MMRGLDHIVHCVDDLDDAAAFFESLGFFVTPIAHHPFGTSNRLIIFQNTYLELLAVTDETKITPISIPDNFGFAARNQHYWNTGSGVCMVCFKSRDGMGDARHFIAKGWSRFSAFPFSRDAEVINGVEKASFVLAFTEFGDNIGAEIFVCEHLTPHLVWQPRYMTHANGASEIGHIDFEIEENHQDMIAEFLASKDQKHDIIRYNALSQKSGCVGYSILVADMKSVKTHIEKAKISPAQYTYYSDTNTMIINAFGTQIEFIEISQRN